MPLTIPEKQLARFLIILLNAATQAIQSVRTKKFKDLDAQLKIMIKKLKDGGDAC